MALVVPNAAEHVLLNNIFNKVAPQDQKIKLFATNVTPAESDTESSYTEAAGGGYADKGLTGSDWTVTEGNPTTAAAPQQVWTFTGALTTNATIYGYYVVQTTSGKILWAEALAIPFTPANNGDQLKITPSFTLE